MRRGISGKLVAFRTLPATSGRLCHRGSCVSVSGFVPVYFVHQHPASFLLRGCLSVARLFWRAKDCCPEPIGQGCRSIADFGATVPPGADSTTRARDRPVQVVANSAGNAITWTLKGRLDGILMLGYSIKWQKCYNLEWRPMAQGSLGNSDGLVREMGRTGRSAELPWPRKGRGNCGSQKPDCVSSCDTLTESSRCGL